MSLAQSSKVLLLSVVVLVLSVISTLRVQAHDEFSYASAVLRDASGEVRGEVLFYARDDHGVLVDVRAEGLPPGLLSIELGATRACGPVPGVIETGSPSTVSPAPGAGFLLPTLRVAPDGTAYATFETARFTIRDLLAGGATVTVQATTAPAFGGPIAFWGDADPAQHVACGDITPDVGML